MNGFQLHNIQHSSPSAINMWAAAPCAYIAKYLLNQKFKFSLAAKAGVLVEEAVVKIIAEGVSQDEATKHALSEYGRASMFGASEADIKRGNAITGMIDFAVQELKQYGEPEMGNDLVYGKKQKKVEMLCRGEGWELPVVGYLDFDFPKRGLIVDLKTTMAAPSNMSDEHTRQGGFYRGASGNKAVRFLYVTGKKAVWHDVPDAAPVLADIKSILNRQERFLALGDSQKLSSIVPINLSSYYWSGDEVLRKEIYGI